MREFDDNIELPGFYGFRKIHQNEYRIVNEPSVDRVNLYIDNKSASFVHDAFEAEIRAIDHLMENSSDYAKMVCRALVKAQLFSNEAEVPENIGVCSISVLNSKGHEYAILGLSFFSLSQELFGIRVQKDKVLEVLPPVNRFSISYPFDW